MKGKIIYESKTGNTKLIAEELSEAIKQDNDILLQSIEEAFDNNIHQDIDIYFLGSWTNKGDCGEEMKKFCNSINGEKVAIFGTAGFGGSQDYFDNLATRFKEALPNSNEVLGNFFCQGKMPSGIRNRYEAMLKANPEDENLKVNIQNFDLAQSHPDKYDSSNARIFARRIIEMLKERN